MAQRNTLHFGDESEREKDALRQRYTADTRSRKVLSDGRRADLSLPFCPYQSSPSPSLFLSFSLKGREPVQERRAAGIEIDFGRLPLLKGRGPEYRAPTKVAGAILRG